YRGLRFGMVLHPQYPPDVYLEGKATRHSMLSREHHGARAVLNALDRLANGDGSECNRVPQDLAIAKTPPRDCQASLGQPFPHDDYLSKLTGLRDQLKAGLSGVAPEQSTQTPLAVPELAGQIKALKAAHSIEATSQRTASRRS